MLCLSRSSFLLTPLFPLFPLATSCCSCRSENVLSKQATLLYIHSIAYIQTLSSIRRQIATADRTAERRCPAFTRLSCCSWVYLVPPSIPHTLPLLSPAHAQSFDSRPPVYTQSTVFRTVSLLATCQLVVGSVFYVLCLSFNY